MTLETSTDESHRELTYSRIMVSEEGDLFCMQFVVLLFPRKGTRPLPEDSDGYSHGQAVERISTQKDRYPFRRETRTEHSEEQ